ncbi:MAG TPA: Ku protein [bacterium]|nr:Ku protein [bacterium]
MRPFWRGYISFGLVTIPVKLYTATEQKDVRFRLLHTECHTPIKNQRFCPHCDRTIEWSDVVRGYEVSKGRFVVVTDEEIDRIPIDTSGNVNIAGFVELREIDPIYYERSYYVVPDEGGAKAFLLLGEALREADRVAIGKVVIREKEQLVALRPYDGALVLSTLYYADEVRAVSGLEELPVEAKVHPNERKMAMQLVENLAMEFTVEQFRDEYRDALQAMIQAKGKGEAVAQPKEAAAAGKVVDLMEALKRSVEMAQDRRRPSGAAKAAGREATPQRRAAGAMHERPR